MSNPWSSETIVAIKEFKCFYCNKKRPKGTAYKFVDGEKSCELCNREYDYIPSEIHFKCKCPLCGVESDVRRWR